MSRKKDIKNKILTLDTETIGLDGALRRIAIYDGIDITYGYKFEDVEYKIMEWVNKGFYPRIYIHNAEFDLRKLDGLWERGYILWTQTKLINGKYVVVTTQDYSIHDSFRLLPEALSDLSRSFDVEHGKLDLWQAVQERYPDQYTDAIDFLSRCHVDDPLYIEYLGYDVISLYEVLEKLSDVSGIKLEDLPYIMTTASLSKYIFKNGFKGDQFGTGENSDFDMLTTCKAWSSEKAIKGNHSGEHITFKDIEAKIRNAYYGGRTEVFKPYLQPIKQFGGGYKVTAYHYDVNSLYPSVMIDNDYPIGYPDYYTNSEDILQRWESWLLTPEGNGLGYITATVFVPEQKIPPLPVHKSKLVFLTGYLQGTWTYHELAYAVKECGVKIIEFKEMIHFKRTYKVFKNFVGVFSELKIYAKKNKLKALEKLAKLLLNTAYGWTCLRRDDKTSLHYIEKLEQFEDRLVYANEELGYIEYMSYVHSDSIQVQVGAYVTSYARLTLLKALKAMSEIGEVYYCDTDSIVTSKPLPPEMVSSTKLGYWDLEGELVKGLFLQPKVYTEVTAEETKVKFKGITKKRQRDLDFNFYMGIYQDLIDGEKDSIIIEKDIERLRSIRYAQKTGTDMNALEHLDKSLNLRNKQKRFTDYKENYTKAWHMVSLDMFNNFSFKPDYTPIRQSTKGGNLIDTTMI